MAKQVGLFRTMALIGGGVAAALVGLAFAGTPFGGDDTGFIPPAANYKCEAGFAKNAAKAAAAVIKCHIKAAGAAFAAKPFDEEGCEAAAVAKAAASNLKLTGCPTCLNTAAQAAIIGSAVGALDSSNGVFFCGGSVLFGGDDTGKIPSSKDELKCESGAIKNVGKLTKAIVKCHIKYAAAVIKAKAFDEEACETAAKGKFDAANAKLTVCPACLSALFPALGGAVEGQIDTLNGGTWCASPSGAFID